jgi:hypothetical protein
MHNPKQFSSIFLKPADGPKVCGKVNCLNVCFECGLFDTLKIGVVTSEVLLASFL